MANDETTRAFSAAVGSTGGIPNEITSGTLFRTGANYDMNPKTGQRPMHFIDDNGMKIATTVMNPLRSDPKVEAVLGELRYKVKPRPESAAAQNIRIAELENQIKAMMALLAQATKINAAPEPVSESTPESTPESAPAHLPRGAGGKPSLSASRRTSRRKTFEVKEKTPIGDF